MNAPRPLNPVLGLPVTRCERRVSRAERIGERVLTVVLWTLLPLLLVGCVVARFAS